MSSRDAAPAGQGEADWQSQGSQWLSGVKEAAMNSLGPGGKKDEDEQYSPFAGLEKSQVLQECRAFNDPQLNPRLCSQLITKILYMLGQGEQLSRSESTSIFFGVTKLFQAKDDHLRRMIYLVMKELNPSAEEVIIVTATLTKDMNSKQDLYRANAIRVLCKIISLTDPSMLNAIERHLKQALVDKNAFVAASALVSGIQLMRVNAEVVKRWVNEVQTVLTSDNQTVQYHALALLHMIKKHDRLAVSKIVGSLARAPIKSPYAQCLLIRFVKKVMEEDGYGARRSCRRRRARAPARARRPSQCRSRRRRRRRALTRVAARRPRPARPPSRRARALAQRQQRARPDAARVPRGHAAPQVRPRDLRGRQRALRAAKRDAARALAGDHSPPALPLLD
jgi:hypothetical protein